MPEYLYPGVYVEETDLGVKLIPGVSTTTDATLQSLAADFRRILQARVPEWTDDNESDPGVTLLEIFAFLAESLLYRANEIPRGRSAALRAAAALAALGGVPGPGCEGVKRPLFFTSQLLDAATLAAGQEYHREKRRLHNRALLG
jgi:phage tail sheath protein FI